MSQEKSAEEIVLTQLTEFIGILSRDLEQTIHKVNDMTEANYILGERIEKMTESLEDIKEKL